MARRLAFILLLTGLLLTGRLVSAEEAGDVVWQVQLVDGSAFVAREAPSRDGRLTLATLEDGTLISVRSERIQSVTEVVIPDEPVKPAWTWKATGNGGSASGDSFVLDNSALAGFVASLPPEDLPEPSDDSSVMVLPEALTAPAVQPARRREVVDRDGRGRAWWEARTRPVMHALRAAYLREQTIERELRVAERNWLYGTFVPGRSGSYLPGYGPVVSSGFEGAYGVTSFGQTRGERFLLLDRVTALREALARARTERDLAEIQYSSLKEEARRAGAWPGWLRVP